MWVGYVEADGSECLSFDGGKAILAFLVPLELYSRGDSPDDTEETQGWFEMFDNFCDGKLGEISQPFFKACYSGDWDYAEDEYAFFLHRSPDLIMEEDKFRKAIQQVREKWTDIHLIIHSVERLLTVFKSEELEPTYFYSSPDSIPAFQYLLDTLKFFSKRRAIEVRIRID